MLLQAVVSGLAVGAVYGLVGIGFTLVWALTRVLAFAHGDLVVASVLVSFLAVIGCAPVDLPPAPLHSVALVLIALAVGLSAHRGHSGGMMRRLALAIHGGHRGGPH